jgi:four helix bundle protein
MPMTHFSDLDVWKKAHALAIDVYRATEAFPPRERFGIAAQMRRSASSIGANIAEGFGRRPLRDKARFYNVAEGSARELENFVLLSRDLGFMKDISVMSESVNRICQMLVRLVDRTWEASEADDRFGYRSRGPRR